MVGASMTGLSLVTCNLVPHELNYSYPLLCSVYSSGKTKEWYYLGMSIICILSTTTHNALALQYRVRVKFYLLIHQIVANV